MTRRRSIAVLVCACALGAGAARPARAEDPQAQPRAAAAAPDLSEYEKRLAQINDQILGLKARLAEEDKKQETILSQLGKISLTKSLLQKELS